MDDFWKGMISGKAISDFENAEQVRQGYKDNENYLLCPYCGKRIIMREGKLIKLAAENFDQHR